MKTLRHLLVAAALLDAAVGWTATDPFAGKWTLDVKKSKYPPGACPRSMVIEMETVGRGVHYSSETVLANGSSTRSEYTAGYDGRPVIVVGAHGLLLPVSLKRSAPGTVVASYTRAQKVVATSRRVVSPDGRLMTITTTSRDASGKLVTNVGVYEKRQ